MGIFIYDSSVRVDLDDHALAHLQVVILAKLRRGESFAFGWEKPAPESGRITVWLDRHIPVLFDFSSPQMPPISRAWVEVLTKSANSGTGLRLVPNPLEENEPSAALTRPEVVGARA